MSLIKLMGVPHPDLNGGQPQPVYIDASRVLLIIQGHQAHPKIGSIEKNREAYDVLAGAVMTLSQKVNGYIPDMTDPVSVEWMQRARVAAGAVNDAYISWGRSYTQSLYHPSVDCTEVQLACGTALEHGVMLTRVWVSNHIEEVARLIEEAQLR